MRVGLFLVVMLNLLSVVNCQVSGNTTIQVPLAPIVKFGNFLKSVGKSNIIEYIKKENTSVKSITQHSPVDISGHWRGACLFRTLSRLFAVGN